VSVFTPKCPNHFRHHCPIRTDITVRTQPTLVSDLNRFLHFSEDVLSKFGNVIVQIQQNTNDKNLAFWTFLKFISNEYPKILSIDVDERLVNEVEQILAELQIERFEIA